jgi:Sulfotransferase family
MSHQALHPVHAGASILPPELAARGPNVIGATGGSGTRVIARIVRAGGMYIGLKLNRYEDALEFSDYYDRWINQYLVSQREGRQDALAEEMAADLSGVVTDHCAGLPAEAIRWGWKEPRSIYLVPFLRSQMPTLRFLHFLRDGRDMAFSENQKQLRKHGSAALDGLLVRQLPEPSEQPFRSIALWSWINQAVADFGERELGSDYLRVRFEDLCAEPRMTVERIYAFFGLEGDVDAAAAEVKPPKTLGRWQRQPSEILARLEREAGPALRRFGYPDG